MQEKDANFVTSQNPSYYTNKTRYLDTFALSIPPWKLPYLLTHVTCLIAYSLEYLLAYSLTHSLKYIHTRFKFSIAAYQDKTIYYYAL